MHRVVAHLLTAAGAALLLVALGGYAEAALARDRVRAAWAAEEASFAGAAARARGRGELEESLPARGAPVGRLLIPAIGLDEVIVEGVGARELTAGPGHLPGSALPGAGGNAIISAHRDRHFRNLDDLRLGDTIVTQTRHKRTVWRIIERQVVGARTPALFSSAEARLTITTCWPVRYLGPATDRLLLTAIPVERQDAPAD